MPLHESVLGSHTLQLPELFSSREGRALLFAVVASLLVHVVTLGFFLNARIGSEPVTLPSTVSIRLVPNNPLLEPEVEEAVTETAASEEALVESAAVEATPEETPETTEQTPIEMEAASEPQELAETPIAEPELEPERLTETEEPLPIAPIQPLVEVPQVVIPSAEDLAQSIRAVRQQDDQRTSRLWAYDCNPLQKESEFITCDDRDETDNSNRVQRFSSQNAITNQTYQRFNPTAEISRGQRSLPVVSENSTALAVRLDAINIPADLSEYLRQEVEAGITHNANQGSITADMMDRMTDQSDAAQMAREFSDDPWIRRRLKPRLSTRVPIGNDR